jgi:hypothetical protein
LDLAEVGELLAAAVAIIESLSVVVEPLNQDLQEDPESPYMT